MHKAEMAITGMALSLLLIATPVQAHHSFSATFTDETITVEGYVDRMSFSNPHVTIFFNVTDEKGEVIEWMSEGGSATGKRRNGWDANTVSQGDYVRITGNSSRNGSPMVSMSTINFVNPFSGSLIGSPDDGADYVEAIASIPRQLSDGRPNISGAWTRGPGGGRRQRDPAPFNEVGIALQSEYDPLNDPQVQCEQPGVVRQAAFTPHPVRLEQYDDYVVLSYEEYGFVRTVYFDDRDLVGGEHSSFGQSIARYEGDDLIIETSHLLGNLTGPNGDALTDQTTTREIYSRVEDLQGASGLAMNMHITDPAHLSDTWILGWVKYYSPGYEFIGVECYKPLAQ